MNATWTVCRVLRRHTDTDTYRQYKRLSADRLDVTVSDGVCYQHRGRVVSTTSHAPLIVYTANDAGRDACLSVCLCV